MIPSAEPLRVADAMRVLDFARSSLKAELAAKNYRCASVTAGPVFITIWTPGTGVIDFASYDEALSYIEDLPLANWTPELIEATLGVPDAYPSSPASDGYPS